MSGARRVSRSLLIALVLALSAGTAAAEEEFFYCGKIFITMQVGGGQVSILRADVRMMMEGIDGHDGSPVGIVVFMHPEKGKAVRLTVSRETLTKVIACLS